MSTHGLERANMLLAQQIRHFRYLQKVHRLSVVDDSSIQPTFEEFISTTPFQYEPLDLRQLSIRLVRILPELSKDGLIQCNILHASHTTASYVCLSYVWDYVPTWDNNADARTERVVLTDGRRLYVRRNLFDFLSMAQHLMVTGNLEANSFLGSSLFWIDAMCINQSDPLERNHQVAQMGEIYSHASSVHVWLGKAMPKLLDNVSSSDEVTRNDERKTILQELVDDRHPDGSYKFNYQHKWPRCDDVDCRHTGIGCGKVGFDEDEDVHDLVKAIYSNPYWKRAWVVQELELARERTFWLSASAISLSFLQDIADGIDGGLYRKGSAHFYDMVRNGQRGTRRDLVIWLSQHANKECADPRDRIYSLLSLRREGSREIPVDYDVPITRLAVHALRGSECICLCSTAMVAKALGITRNIPHNELPRNLSGPWVEVDMSGYFMEPDDRVVPESVFVDNICGCFERRELKLTLLTDALPRYDLSFTARHFEKRWYTVRMALWMVLELAPTSPGLCRRALGTARQKPVARVGWM
ncbi:heterokaryon incompatibility protein-domain-containing protein [Paraphoma chrysanthemicola]|nr:heterokaryon incompatibility protein-domain-containing protein [Paraphoma chrysanthemicola]